MSEPLAVIFDVDGVLTDSYVPHFLSWQRMFGELGRTFSEDQFRATFGRTNRDIFGELYEGKLPEDQLVAWGDRKELLYREIIAEKFAAIDGAVELIDALVDAGIKVGVGSSGPPENIRVTLEKLGRADKVGAVVTAIDVKRGKPDPQVFLIAAERLNVPPARCAVVEDAVQGVEAANRAGMSSIGLTSTTTREKLAHAKLVVDSLRELTPDRIAALISAPG
jgi:beta-phosphoglucomutase